MGRGSAEYNAWYDMNRRCYNPLAHNFGRYGGRGISVCQRWRESFGSFLADMGPRPSPKHSIDRKDNDGNYEPGNCRWGTRIEQSRNRSDNRRVTFRGETRCLQEWVEALGLSRNVVNVRLLRGWSVEDALTTPVIPRRSRVLTDRPVHY